MSSQKVEDLRAYKVRTVNQTLDEATGMRKKAWRSTMCEQSDFRILVEDDESESGVIRELIYMVVRFIAWWFTIILTFTSAACQQFQTDPAFKKVTEAYHFTAPL